MSKINFLYLTTNLINGKQYIGEHSAYNTNDYYLGSGKLILAAIKKYGKHNFKREIIKIYETKQEAFDNQEFYINKFNTLNPNGYNLSPSGGHGSNGGFMSDETKRKIIKTRIKNGTNIAWNKDKKLEPLKTEHKEKIRRSNIGKHKMSDEHKEKIIIANKKPLSQKHKDNISQYQKSMEVKTLCPFCHKEINARQYRRSHRRKCKKENG